MDVWGVIGVLTICFDVVLAFTPHADEVTPPFHTRPLSKEDYKNLHEQHNSRSSTLLPHFKYVYVTNNGSLVSRPGSPGHTIEVAGSPLVHMTAVRTAATYVSKMVKLMPSDIFQRISVRASVGVFTKQEKITVFPEFAMYKNGNCGTSCTGSCAKTCTSDGRKWEDIGGAGGLRAAVLDENVVCGPHDPHHHHLNVILHEFAHIVHRQGMSTAQKSKVTQAYNYAKSHSIWNLHSYAMSTDGEYIATAVSVFFGANKDSQGNTGGMNLCGTSDCRTESAARGHLKLKDNRLYELLVEVYTSYHPNVMSGLSVCPS
ncbi:uncharacterized protein LOC101850592 [Aplysia californica]|uniref:Uncharacterized protein LOC101850592 n=1 Tax=Aplysia californica TaxID=6500 RepID=A0ABM0K1B2_APLCA|nr:uncharacterized protein LOC101850592 [Aplysia californica]